MPELSRFYGIVVQVYYNDHLPAHFHVEYAGAIAKIDIETLSLIAVPLQPGRGAWSSNGPQCTKRNCARLFKKLPICNRLGKLIHYLKHCGFSRFSLCLRGRH